MRYPPLLGTFRRITHPFATRQRTKTPITVRLAYVKHAASDLPNQGKLRIPESASVADRQWVLMSIVKREIIQTAS